MNLLIHFDDAKDRRVLGEHGVSLSQLAEIFRGPHLMQQRQEDPEQWKAVGWTQGRLCAVVYEERQGPEGPYYHLITGWKATTEERHAYQKAYP